MRIEVCRCLDVMPNVDATFRMLCFENSSRIVENREPILVLVSCVFFSCNTRFLGGFLFSMV